MPEIYDREGIASLRRQRPVKAYETPQHYYEGPAGANIGERLLSLQREGLSIPMHTFLGQNVSGKWGEYFPDKEYRGASATNGGIGFEAANAGRATPHIDTLNRGLLSQEGHYLRNMPPEQAAKLRKFMEKQDESQRYGTRAWLQRRYRNVPKHTRPPIKSPFAVLLSTQKAPDEVYAKLSPERNVAIQRTRNLDLKNVARHEAGHHGLALAGEQGEEFNRPMDYITTRGPSHKIPALDYRVAALKNLGISEPEMIRMFESKTDFRNKLNKMLAASNARLIAQGRPPIDNQAIIKKALAERRQALSRPVYPKAKHTGGMIERNPYPYEARAI